MTTGCPPQVGAPVEGILKGVVIKGPLRVASVRAFAVDGDGRRAKEVGAGQTDDTGAFSVSIGGHAGPAIVCAEGGTYTEEATGGLVELAENELCATVSDHELGKETTGVLLTPLTTFHTALAGCFTESGKDASFEAANQHAALRLNDFFGAGVGGFDLRTTVPFDVTASAAPSLTPEVWAGILVAGLSESAKQHAVASGLDPGVRVTAATLTTALTADIDDGACTFDGQSETGVLSQGTVLLTSDTLRGAPQGLGSGVLRFLENPDRNVSGIAPANVTDLVVALNGHQSEIFGDAGQGGDVLAPVVTFVTPAEGSAVSGVIDVSVTATDAGALTELVFLEPASITATERICEQDGACTLLARLNTSLEDAGALTLRARARDVAGNTTTETVTVTINDDAPNIAISSPTNGASVSGDFTISVTASDGSGIQSLTVAGVAPENLTISSLRTDELLATWHTTREPEGPVTLTFTATDTGGQAVSVSVNVEVDNLDDGVINGAVDLGTPVKGGRVTAIPFTAAGRGGPVATADVDEETGSFTLTNPFYSGPLLLVVTGGTFVDPATGSTFTLRGGQELTAAIGDVQPGETTLCNVNAWTTLAAARAEVVARSAGADIEEVFEENNERIGLHLRRDGPEQSPLPIRRTNGVDLSSTTIESTNDRAVLALAHAGLSRMALELADGASLDPGAITIVDVVDDLGRDLRNALYDGVDDDGATVFFDPGSTLPATPLTLRTDLASAVSSFLTDAPLRDGATLGRNGSGIDNELLFGPGNFYEDIAENNDFRLFSTPGVPFDTLPPEVELVFEAEPDAPVGSARVEADVRILGQADDVGSGLNRFNVLFPEGLVDGSALTGELRLSVPATLPPNMDALSGACAAAAEADPALVALDPSAQLCVCVEASDGTENLTHKVFCFTRPEPVAQFSSPTENQPFNATDPTVPFAARVVGGWQLASCRLEAASGAGGDVDVVDLTVDADDANECVFDTSAPRSRFDDGVHEAVVTAADIAGNTTVLRRSFAVETSAPTVAITSPLPDQALSTTSYTITGTVEDPSVARVELTLTRTFGTPPTVEPVFTGTRNAQLVGSGSARTWSLSVADVAGGAKSGRRDLTARAFDTQGNASAPIAISFSVDNVAPPAPTLTPLSFSFEGATAPVERPGNINCVVGTLCIDKRRPVPAAGRPRGQVFFATAATVARTIERWSTRVADAASAPELTVTAADAGGAGVREVRFAIRASCAANSGQLTQTSTTTASTAIRLTSGQGFDLLNTHQAEDAAPLCLSVAAVDRAGNIGAIANQFFRWRTVAPPLNVGSITSVGLPDALDASSRDGPGFTSWLSGNTGIWRAMHVHVHNPHTEAVSFGPGDPITFDITLRGSRERRFANSRLTVWAGDPSRFMRNAQATDAETSNASSIAPRWDLGALGSGAGPRVWSLALPCTASSCAADAFADGPPPCGLSASCDEDDARFNDALITPFTIAREISAVTPTISCNATTPTGLPVQTSPCTSDGAPFFIVPPGQTVVFSWVVSHSRGARQFVAPGWTSADVNNVVPFFYDDDPSSGPRSTLQQQTVTPDNTGVLWLTDKNGTLLARNLLWTDRPTFLRCGGETDANTVECHSGRDLRRIDHADVVPSISFFRPKTRHGAGTNRSDTLFIGTGTTAAVPGDATRTLTP